MPASIPRLFPFWQMRCRIDSESVVVWKITPASDRVSWMLPALTRLPLCARAISPSRHRAASGWALRTSPPPAVE